MRKHHIFTPLVEALRSHRSTVGPQSSKLMMRVRFPLRAPPPSHFQTRAGSPMRSVVCKTACEGLTPSRLSTATDHDGLVTLDSLIRSPHRVRFTGDPRAARDMRARVADAKRIPLSRTTRRWLSSDNTCSTSRTRQVRSLRAARLVLRSSFLSIVQRRDHSPRKGEMKVRILLLRPIYFYMPM